MPNQNTGENATNPANNDGNTVDKRDNKGRFIPGAKANPSGIFTPENQPSGDAKSIGRLKKKASREILVELLSAKVDFEDNSAVKAELITIFGKKLVKNASAYELMAMRQMVKALKANDTQAFMALSNQTFGTLQKMEYSGPGGQPIQMKSQVTRVVVVKNPHAASEPGQE
jgi:hypothetical protein